MKHIVLSQTCQGEALRYMLLFSEEFRARYECTFVPNFRVADGVSRVDTPESLRALLPGCDVFVYHDLAAYDFPKLLRELPEGCPALRVPYATSTVYWPSHDFQNPIWLVPYATTALIPWPCRLLDALIVAHKDKDSARRAYLDLDIPAVMDVEANFADQLRYLRQAEKDSIFSLSAYFLEHFRDLRLFHLINHPSIQVFRHMANCLLLHLGLAPLTLTPDDPFCKHQIPVHPSIRRHYGLTWCDDDTPVSLFERQVGYEEYISIYIDAYVERFGFQPLPPPRGKAKRKRSGRLAAAIKNLLGRKA